MSETLDPKALAAFSKYLFGRYWDLNARVETLILLLQHRGVFSDEEFAELLKQVRADYDSHATAATLKAVDAAYHETIHQFLEGFEGTKQ